MARIAVIPGDGIGPEVMAEGLKVLAAAADATGVEIDTVPFDYGAERYLRDGTTLPDEGLAELRDDFDAILLGALGDPRIPDMRHGREILLRLRFDLDLYINLRPVKLLDARFCPLKDKGPDDIDIMVFRENTEGIYVGAGGNFKKGTPDEVAIQEDVSTRKGVERIIRAAFEHALESGRRSVCMSDKSNAMRFAGDLWQRVFHEVRADYPKIESFHLFVDVLAMELVRAPERFDVIVTNNLFGDIVTDLGAQISGGIGLAASGNIHPGGSALFEPVHGSAPDIAGKGIANPLATILSVGMLLSHLGHADAAGRVDAAVMRALSENKITRELGGTLSTHEVGDFVAAAVR